MLPSPQLVESILNKGQILPVYICEAQIIDGRKRHAACLQLGQDPKMKEVTREKAMPLLFALHPERALLHFCGAERCSHAFRAHCAMYDASPAAMLAAEKRAWPPAPRAERIRDWSRRVYARLSQEQQQQMRATAKRFGVSPGEVIAGALEVALKRSDELRAAIAAIRRNRKRAPNGSARTR